MTGSQHGHKADSIDIIGNVIASSLHFFIWVRDGGQRSQRETEEPCKGSCCPLSISSVLISEAATAILSYCCLADTPQPIDESLGWPSLTQHFHICQWSQAVCPVQKWNNVLNLRTSYPSLSISTTK